MTRAPRGRLKVVPDDWSERHQPAAYGFLTGDCEAFRAGAPGDWTPGGTVTAGGVEWRWRHMPCSAQFLTQSNRPITVADGVVVLATHRVSVPIATSWLRYGDTIVVLDNPDDPGLNGRELQVLVTETGTTNWTRDYLCQDVNNSQAKAA